ncbi:phasin family protein [Noviherbaspirillum sp. CPCC 100848]|uniref:Phasin family protein n=1 Tax=Noviherbaspirillum album TaxID=3080276 RepID=A0ABU6JBH9_9BURK|nr:phasin family protein [Noviherbaspirillum sp. CPCC 100848]MEC4720900.1 phasin family protein [Noviherbaspirillum sp. CPCC 100848]
MFLFNQSLPPSAKAHLESQFTFMSELSKQLFTSVQRINDLNISIAQSVLQDTLHSTREVASAQNPYEAISIAAGQVQPAAERLRAYQQQLTNIAANTQVDMAKTAEVHVPATSRTATALADEVARRANEEAQKATQRQKATIDKLAAPIGKPDAGKGTTANVH